MTVTVHLHGNLRRFLAEGRAVAPVTVAGGTTVAGLLDTLGAALDTWLCAVNGHAVDRETVLHDGDTVDCYEAIAGGSAGGARGGHERGERIAPRRLL